MAKKKPQGKVVGGGSAGIPSYPSSPKGLHYPPAQSPGQVWVPGNPGVENKPIDPFHTADDLTALAEMSGTWGTALNDIQTGLDNLLAQSTFDKTNVEKAKIQDLNTSADEMSGRGLGQSSIKDADLFDIEATARLRKEFIDTQLKTASLAADRQRRTIQDSKDAWMGAFNQKAVENAQGVNANMPKWQVEPTTGKFAYSSPQTAPRQPKLTPQQTQATFNYSQSQQAGGASAAKAEAKARMGGKTGGRGKKAMGTVGSGSAGIR